MLENRTPEERTAIALALLDGAADLWWAESGFAKCNWPEPIVRAVKQAHVEGLYAGRCSTVDQVVERNKVIEEAAKQADLRERVFGGEPTTSNEQQIVQHIAAAIRNLKR